MYGVLGFVCAWREGRLNAALLFQEMVHIHPNQEFLGPKESFRVDVASLDALLAYTEKDDREPTFEVSVFAELFREMLEARFGRGILRTLELLERQERQVRAAPPRPRFWPAPLTSRIMGAEQAAGTESRFCIATKPLCGLPGSAKQSAEPRMRLQVHHEQHSEQ